MVPHRGTNWAALWLTVQIGRDAVLSESYGRGYLREAYSHTYVARNANYLQQPVTKQSVMFINRNLKERNKGFFSQAQTSIGRSICHLSHGINPRFPLSAPISKLVAQHLAYCFLGSATTKGEYKAFCIGGVG